MTEPTLDIIERCMRLVRQATDLDAADRAILNYVLHDAIDQLETQHAQAQGADGEDVDRLTAELDAARVQLGTLRSLMADIAAANAGDATIAQRYDAGYHAGTMDDPTPMGNTDEWYMRGFKAGQQLCDVAGLHQDLDQLRKQLADVETALAEKSETLTAAWASREKLLTEMDELQRERREHTDASNGTAEAFWSAGWQSGNKGETEPAENGNVWYMRGWNAAVQTRLLANYSTQNQSATKIVIVDATPAELAAVVTSHNGDGHGDDDGQDTPKNGKSTRFRFNGTDEELRKQVINAIKAMSKRIGRTPSIIDWDVDCRTYALPTFQTIQSRLNCTWASLIAEAGLTPLRKGSRA